ncbi:MAG TPA: hypothetical protein VF043_22795 [Ktedonobacteraceae bacterium]
MQTAEQLTYLLLLFMRISLGNEYPYEEEADIRRKAIYPGSKSKGVNMNGFCTFLKRCFFAVRASL